MTCVEVIPYNSQWPLMFQTEALLIKKALGENCLAIHHIGSTSVKGLSAKPIIDILPVVKNILEVDKKTEAMELLGYEVKGEHGIAFRRFFQKGQNKKTYNVHVFEEKNPEINRYLKFRDWLCSHEEDAKAYGELKMALAKQFPNDILNYCFAKEDFVTQIDKKNGFSGWRMVKALTNNEWSVVHDLRKDFYHSSSNPFNNFLENGNHIHFVLYVNNLIIGYAHLEFLLEKQAILHLIIIKESHRHCGYGSQFLTLCERWLSHQKVFFLKTNASEKSNQFFYKHGFKPTSIDKIAPHNIKQPIEMSKILI